MSPLRSLRRSIFAVLSLAVFTPTGFSQLLWSSPMVTCAGCGFGGADVSEAASSTSTGVRCGTGTRVANNFSCNAGAGWDVTYLLVFGYQDGAPTTTSPITSATLRFWDGPPGQPGSNILFGDTTTDILIGSSWEGIYRVPFGGSHASVDRAIFSAQLEVDRNVPFGSFWFDYSLEGTGIESPFTISNFGNSVSTTNNWQTTTSLGLELPFQVHGGFGGFGTYYCSSNVNSTGNSATLYASGSQLVSANQFSIIATGVPPGQFAYVLA